MEAFSTRQNKVSRLIQKELSMIMQKEFSSIGLGKMITVTTVRISPDLSVAKVYLSIYPSKDAESTLKLMDEEKKQIRLALGRRVRNQLRIVPEIAFFIDDSHDYVENINKLLK